MLTFSLDKISLKPHSKILDVGCGEGRHIFGKCFCDQKCAFVNHSEPAQIVAKKGPIGGTVRKNITGRAVNLSRSTQDDQGEPERTPRRKVRQKT